MSENFKFLKFKNENFFSVHFKDSVPLLHFADNIQQITFFIT